MTKRWQEVEQSPNFQSLAPQQQVMAKKQYFNDVVSTKPEFSSLPFDHKESAKKQFFGGTLLEDAPESQFKPKNVALETVKGTAGYIGGRAKGLLEGAGQAITHPVEAGKGMFNLAAGAMQKVPFSPTARLLKSLPGAQERDQAVNDYGRSMIEHPIDYATDTALGAGAGILGGRLLKALPSKVAGVKKGIQSIEPKAEEFASKINNELIGAKRKDVRIGDPGGGMAKEGIKGTNHKALYEQVNTKLDTLKSSLDDAYSKNHTVIGDYSKAALQPLANLRKKLMTAPNDHKATIRRLDGIIRDITGESTGNIRKYHLNPSEARELKQYIADRADYTVEGKGDDLINKALKESYHGIDGVVDNLLPQTKELNGRVTDLIAAKKSLRTKLENLSTKSPIPGSLGEVANIPFKFLKGPRITTGISSMITKKYPKNLTTQVFNKPLFGNKTRSSLLTNQTKLLPAPKDVPYSPTGKRNVTGQIVTPYEGGSAPIVTPPPYKGTTLPAVVNNPRTSGPNFGLGKGKSKGDILRSPTEEKVTPREIKEVNPVETARKKQTTMDTLDLIHKKSLEKGDTATAKILKEKMDNIKLSKKELHSVELENIHNMQDIPEFKNTGDAEYYGFKIQGGRERTDALRYKQKLFQDKVDAYWKLEGPTKIQDEEFQIYRQKNSLLKEALRHAEGKEFKSEGNQKLSNQAIYKRQIKELKEKNQPKKGD